MKLSAAGETRRLRPGPILMSQNAAQPVALLGTAPPPVAPPVVDEVWTVNHDPAFVTMLKVALFLAAIWSFGRLMRQVGLPANIGSLAAGVLLGPEFARLVPYASPTCGTDVQGGVAGVCGDDVWRLIGNVGITLLIFEFGTFVQLQKVRQVRIRTIILATLSTIGPLLVGFLIIPGVFAGRSTNGIARSFQSYLPDGFATGCALAPTSPVVLRLLDEDDLLNTLPGQTALLSIFAGMIASFVALGVLLNVADSASIDSGARVHGHARSKRCAMACHGS